MRFRTKTAATGRAASLNRLLVERWPELLIFGLGVLLRVSLLLTFPWVQSYDSISHMRYLTWFRDHFVPPSVNAMKETFHPPFYYFVGGMLARFGARARHMQAFAVLCGTTRLALFWLGIERWLGGGVWARRSALFLAAVLPASVFLDGMVGAESLSTLFATAILVLAPAVLAAEGARRLRLSLLLGVLAGLALLVKISALMLIGAIGLGALFDLAFGRGDARTRLRRLVPLVAGLLACALMSGWYFARNVREEGKPFLSSFDTSERHMLEPLAGTPYLARRPPAYLLGWSSPIHAWPFWPSAAPPSPRFWPLLVASTFVDYYNYGYARLARLDEPRVMVNDSPMRPSILPLSIVSFDGGLVIALLSTIAWFAALIHVLRRRDGSRLVLLAAPLLAVLGAIHFAWSYPLDYQGVVKGTYLQFAAGPLCGVFGLAVEWLRARSLYYAAPPLIALAAVTSYSVGFRLLAF